MSLGNYLHQLKWWYSEKQMIDVFPLLLIGVDINIQNTKQLKPELQHDTSKLPRAGSLVITDPGQDKNKTR